MDLILFLAVAAAVILGWLVATWYFADDEPVFGRGTTTRITFKNVIANAVFDVVDLLRPLWMRVWLNMHFTAVLALDAVSLMQEDMRHAILGNFYGGIAFVALNLLVRYGATAAHPPVARS